MPDPVYPEGIHDRRVVKTISAKQDIYLSLSAVNKTNDWCNLQTEYSAENSVGINRLVMPYTFPSPCVFVYWNILGKEYILMAIIFGVNVLLLNVFFFFSFH